MYTTISNVDRCMRDTLYIPSVHIEMLENVDRLLAKFKRIQDVRAKIKFTRQCFQVTNYL